MPRQIDSLILVLSEVFRSARTRDGNVHIVPARIVDHIDTEDGLAYAIQTVESDVMIAGFIATVTEEQIITGVEQEQQPATEATNPIRWATNFLDVQEEERVFNAQLLQTEEYDLSYDMWRQRHINDIRIVDLQNATQTVTQEPIPQEVPQPVPIPVEIDMMSDDIPDIDWNTRAFRPYKGASQIVLNNTNRALHGLSANNYSLRDSERTVYIFTGNERKLFPVKSILDGTKAFMDRRGILYVNQYLEPRVNSLFLGNDPRCFFDDFGTRWMERPLFLDLSRGGGETNETLRRAVIVDPRKKSNKKLYRKRPIPVIKDVKYYASKDYIA